MELFIDLHIHTNASSHAYSSIYEYVQVARDKKLQVIAMTDHGPMLDDSPHMWHFLNLNAIPETVCGVRILKAIEANILEDGTIDCSYEIAKKLDFVMAGFHFPVYQPNSDIKKNTDNLLRVINDSPAKIIVHPGNPKFPIDYQAIASVAAAKDVALEINSASKIARKGSEENCCRMIKAVKEAGGFISVGSDSHFCTHVGEFSHAIDLITRHQFPKNKIINSSKDLLSQFLQIQL